MRLRALCLSIPHDHSLDAASQAIEHAVPHQARQVPVRGAQQPHPPRLHGARGIHLRLAADLVHDDDVGRVVLHCLNHDARLLAEVGHHHPPCQAHGPMHHHSVATYLVGCVHHDNTVCSQRQHTSGLPDNRRLAASGISENQHGRFVICQQQVGDHVCVAEHCTSHAHGQTIHLPSLPAHGADAMQGSIDARSVVWPELALQPMHGLVQIFAGHH
mmetsp:Transcript_77418/g.221705  ORF Transcript_77418/g.221705 Transcript_77418/m.221705 type:complete len:216 (-) Transcript_77418:617-1264(-)